MVAAEQFGFEKAVAGIEEVLADPEVEAVSICAPNFLHRDFAVAAARAGKPFWIEKPMGVSQRSRARSTAPRPPRGTGPGSPPPSASTTATPPRSPTCAR